VHDVHDEHRHVAEGGTSRAQIRKRLMTWGVDHEEARDFEVEGLAICHDLNVLAKVVLREVSCADLLRDAACLVRLHVRFSEFVEDESLACVYVAHNADNGAAQLASILLSLALLPSLQQSHLTLASRRSVPITRLHIVKST